MIPKPDTRLIARINKRPSATGIASYNSYLQKLDANALCLEIHNPNICATLDGLKQLGFAGAITVHQARDKELHEYVDEIEPVAKRIGVVGYVTYKNKVLKGCAQGGLGLLSALQEKVNLKGKRLVIIGAGKMAQGLLARIEEQNVGVSGVVVCNRTKEAAMKLAKEYVVVSDVLSIDNLLKAKGDVLVNTTSIGSEGTQELEEIFTKELVSRFEAVGGVIFLRFRPKLIQLADELGVPSVAGWETFAHATGNLLEKMLGLQTDIKAVKQSVRDEFEK
jgi:shikimate dehydrogenase